MITDPRERQAAFNATSRLQWDGFGPHRERVTALLSEGGDPGRSRLCVLGAGNANDLDLNALLMSHREVHLVDLDREALEVAAERQGVGGRPGLRQVGGVDVTGLLEAIGGWTPMTSIDAALIEALADWPAAHVAGTLPGPYDRVASTCLLSPLIGNAYHSLGPAHPRFGAVGQALRDGHLRLLPRLVRSGGEVVLITDVVSSDTLPGLPRLADSALAGLLPELARTGNHFHGLDPVELGRLVRDVAGPSCRSGSFERLAPWRWSLHGRTYLVLAFRYRVDRE